MGILLYVLPCICSFFFLSRFLSKITPQPFKIETSNLVYWFKMTGNNMELKMDILLFVVPCIFSFSLHFSSKIPATCFGSAKAGV